MNLKTVYFLIKTMTFVTLFPLLASAAVDSDGNQIVSLTDAFQMNVDQPVVNFVIPYPATWGAPSTRICNVEVRADGGNISNLLSQVQIQDLVGGPSTVLVVNALTIRLDYSQARDLYSATFTVKTKNGSSLKQAIATTMGPGKTLVLVGTPCIN